MVSRAVFLDRDGVLVCNVPRDGRYLAPRTMAEFSLYPDAAANVARLRQAGFLCVVVTNQPDVGHGLISPETLDVMHERLAAAVLPDAILTCPHRQDERCNCRKPQAGLLRLAEATFGIDFANSWMVGDRGSDVVAGQAVGCRTILVDHNLGEGGKAVPDAVVGSLEQAVTYILERIGKECVA